MDTAPAPGAWPLSAPATALLRDPKADAGLLLRLALRELVVRGAVRVGPVEKRRLQKDTVRLSPGPAGTGGLPETLRVLDEALRPHLTADGMPAAKAVTKAAGWRADLDSRVRDAAREELRTRGLLARDSAKVLGVVPRTRWEPTPSGQAWARSASDAAVAAAAVLPAAGLLLVLDEELQRRLRDSAGAEASFHGGELDGLDACLGDAGPALDAACDSGGGGGDGGDGGGGGD